MGYIVGNIQDLANIDLDNIYIDGDKIIAIPRLSNDGSKFILQGDKFNQYDLEGILQYLETNKAEWELDLQL